MSPQDPQVQNAVNDLKLWLSQGNTQQQAIRNAQVVYYDEVIGKAIEILKNQQKWVITPVKGVIASGRKGKQAKERKAQDEDHKFKSAQRLYFNLYKTTIPIVWIIKTIDQEYQKRILKIAANVAAACSGQLLHLSQITNYQSRQLPKIKGLPGYRVKPLT